MRLGILGAHTEVARTLIDVITERDIDVAITRYTTTENVAEGLHPFGPDTVNGCDAFVLAFEGAVAQAFATQVADQEKPMIDLAGASAARREGEGPLNPA